AIFAGVSSLIARVLPAAAARATVVGRGYAVAVGTWVLLGIVAIRVVHGTTFLGAEAGPPSTTFLVAAVVLAVAIGYVVTTRHAQFGKLPPRFRRAAGIVAATMAASAAGGLLSIRQSLDLESLVRREIAAIAAAVASVPTQPARMNMLLLTIDTLRADRIGAYGYDRARTPALDGLARQGALFERAIAQSSWTRPSFGSLFTSRYPSDHQAAWRLLKNAPGERQSLYNRPLRADLPTVAEILDAGGYLTIGVNTNVQTSRLFGFDHGFDHYIDVSRPLSVLTDSVACRARGLGLSKLCRRWSAVSPDYPYLTGDRVLEIFHAVAERLENSSGPFFLWLHLMDPHVPYRAHDGSDRSMGYDDIERLLAGADGAVDATRETGAMYDAAVAFADRCVGELLARLDGSDSLVKTAVVVTSDHGEELLERWRAERDRPDPLRYYYRGYGHGHTMYDELLRVPMILRLPDRRYAGARVSSAVGHIDVAPTLLGLAGIASDNPRYRPEGIDLASLLGSAGASTRAMRSEATLYGAEVKALAAAGRKIIARFADGERERYDLETDPQERRDTGAAERPAFESLESELDRWLSSLPPEPDPRSANETGGPSIDDAQVRQQLEALGYIQ
ncbi:MAG TPA: sulfatase, partial [Candidatus Binatia bacterium]|nr:sulfatase [Candidatus Binatia bacterium]